MLLPLNCSDAREKPKRKNTTFRTWQKFEIKDGKYVQYMTTGEYCKQLSHTASRIIVLIINSPFSTYATCCNMNQEVATGTTVFPKAGGTKHQQNYICVRIFVYYMQFSLRYFFYSCCRWVWSISGMLIDSWNWNARRKACPLPLFSPEIHMKCTDIEPVHVEKPASSFLSYGMSYVE